MEWKHLPRKIRDEIVSKHRRFKVIVTALLVLTLFSTTGYIAWLVYLKPQPQVISGINFYRKPITVSIAGQRQRLEMFDTYHFNIELGGTAEIQATDDNGQVLETRKHSVAQQSGILMDLWADSEELNQCVVSAEVTDKYYSINQVQTPASFANQTDVSLLTTQPTNSFYTTIRVHEDKYIYLDTYSGSNLPTNLDTFMDVYGYYFVPCSEANDRAKVATWVDWWRTYNPESQRRLYQAELDRIATSTEYK